MPKFKGIKTSKSTSNLIHPTLCFPADQVAYDFAPDPPEIIHPPVTQDTKIPTMPLRWWQKSLESLTKESSTTSLPFDRSISNESEGDQNSCNFTWMDQKLTIGNKQKYPKTNSDSGISCRTNTVSPTSNMSLSYASSCDSSKTSHQSCIIGSTCNIAYTSQSTTISSTDKSPPQSFSRLPDKKGTELINQVKKQLEDLYLEEKTLHNEVSLNEEVGQVVAKRLEESKCMPKDLDKFHRHLTETESLTKLQLNIRGRLSKYEITSQIDNRDSQDANILKIKINPEDDPNPAMRSKLQKQLEDSQILKKKFDERTRYIHTIITVFVNEETNYLFSSYLQLKVQLYTNLKDTNEKITLAKQQIVALNQE
jgi:hypothetical protein